MKKLNLLFRILLGLLLLMPVMGALGIFPEPTAEMYSTQAAWEFSSALTNSGYMMPMIGLLALVCSVLFFANKTAIAAALLAPFTTNVIAFHVFLDATLLSSATIPAYILVLLNGYFLWQNLPKYKALWS